jgi:integrase
MFSKLRGFSSARVPFMTTERARGRSDGEPAAKVVLDAAPIVRSARTRTPAAALAVAALVMHRPSGEDLTALEPELADRSRRLAVKPLAPATVRAYTHDWGAWTRWCKSKRLTPLPAEEGYLRTYLMLLSDEGLTVRSLQRAYAAIRSMHTRAGQQLPTMVTVRNLLSNLSRERAREGYLLYKGKAPLRVEFLRRVREILPYNAVGIRNMSILLLGFAAALRRSEVVSLNVEDLAFVDKGLEVTLRRGKTDQEGKGRKIPVPRAKSSDVCPVFAVSDWIEKAHLTEGPLFRRLHALPEGRYGVLPGRIHPNLIAEIVKDFAERAGLDPSKFSGHSLRSGFVTSAAAQRFSTEEIMQVTGHTNFAQVREYIKHEDLFESAGGKGIL